MTAAASANPAGEPVEEYLDKLLLTLPGRPRQVRHTLAEVQEHLSDAVEEEMSAGLSRYDAEAAAVRRLGPLGAVTGRDTGFSRPTAALLRRTALAGSLVGGVALVAVGLSGFVAWALDAIRGGSFVTAPWAPGSYTVADCARWLAGDPGTHSCATAMVADHVVEIMTERYAAGILGLVVLAAYLVLRRRWQDRGTLTALPVGSAEAAGGILAAMVALGTLAIGLNLDVTQRGQGAGQLLSFSAAALAAAIFFTIRLRQVVRTRPAL